MTRLGVAVLVMILAMALVLPLAHLAFSQAVQIKRLQDEIEMIAKRQCIK
ncbi:MAG: hypothetical protein IPJ84_19090 [Bdellovibrionales bacterium]|nr:hypothetical protein [Bdellovibrionales bacterium]MBK7892876.1 hypothetical protein [Bdellovibrionales bacterium]